LGKFTRMMVITFGRLPDFEEIEGIITQEMIGLVL
jgi:hypothetical protein